MLKTSKVGLCDRGYLDLIQDHFRLQDSRRLVINLYTMWCVCVAISMGYTSTITRTRQSCEVVECQARPTSWKTSGY